MLLETDAFHALARSARIDAWNDWNAEQRQQRLTIRGQIRLEPRRTQKEAEDNPPPAPAPAGKIIKGQKRQHVVARIAETLHTSKLSPFEYEGACRHGIRSELCLEGHNWQHADAEAAAIVDESLKRLHARRPSYDEGQREYSVSPDFCSWCGSPLDDEAHRGRHISYCSEVCARRALDNREINSHRKETRAFHAAWDVVLRSQNPYRDCEECGKGFRPRRSDERFCSPSCAGRHNLAEQGSTPNGAAFLDDRSCPTCKTIFHPRKSDQVYCSPECGFEARHTIKERPCEQCGTLFLPTYSAARFCSQACHYLHRADKRIEKTCTWCGSDFIGKAAHGHTCGEACRQAERKFALGVMPQMLAPHIFDHFISIPALEAATNLSKGSRP